jgi:dTDP-4-dehydrorhamnose 3,5-epimerase
LHLPVSVTPTRFEGVVIIEPSAFTDHRGFFMESYSQRSLEEVGISLRFVQDNHSRSVQHVLRGLHYQDAGAPQFRLVRCTAGEVFDVVVDLRVGSPTFGQWLGVHLSADNRRQLLMRPEFAHGFCVLSESAEVQYKCSNFHSPSAERALAWDDPQIGIEWPVKQPVQSERDRHNPTLVDYLANPAFHYHSIKSDELFTELEAMRR